VWILLRFPRLKLLELRLTGLGASIDKDGCVRWVGETYLEATAPGAGSAISESQLLEAWRDQLPEAWRGDVSLSILPVSRILESIMRAIIDPD
jgi:hypothetical protein